MDHPYVACRSIPCISRNTIYKKHSLKKSSDSWQTPSYFHHPWPRALSYWCGTNPRVFPDCFSVFNVNPDLREWPVSSTYRFDSYLSLLLPPTKKPIETRTTLSLFYTVFFPFTRGKIFDTNIANSRHILMCSRD